MKPGNVIIFLIISMIVVLILIGLIIAFFFLDLNWFKKPENNYVKYEKKEVIDKKSIDSTSDIISKKDSYKVETTTTTITIAQTSSTTTTTIENKKMLTTKTEKENIDSKKDKDKKFKEYKEISIKDDVIVTDENKSAIYTIKLDSFHSNGEYVSEEEYKYRVSLVNNLQIKTVVIDSLTKGNGVSQEFYKVVYQNKMIPAKILDEIVESKEFRSLIPEKYLKDEIKIKGLPSGEKIVFKNEDIKNLLILWTKGKLTPFQKAWLTKAEK
ncbi:MAG TPA: hypothetical protein PLE45_07325 [Spirochaetota bacterium]|nr:hypothetical protein [Spirochaetota bacterium]HOL57056.1 hypothetical protein [Spirochaetota bacterium]HPP04328.1 hypothetical protein [Spirochaetota bacterium]